MGPQEHVMGLGDPWFEYVKSNRKIYEGRRWWEPTQKIKRGDIILFKRQIDGVKIEEGAFKKKVKRVVVYDTFETALKITPLEDVLPGVKSIKDGVQIYLKYVSLKTQLSDGVCMIELEEEKKEKK